MPDARPSSPLRIAIAGSSSLVGAALAEALAPRHPLRILTRSMAREAPEDGTELRPCDHFSKGELAAALRGVDVAVYLVHNREPSARLDQAQARDMDLLVADNFGWAARQAGVSRILCRAPLLADPTRPAARDARETEAVLGGHGVPLTVLRTGLVVGPGGELSRLLVRMVRHLPVILLPRLAEVGLRPITLQAFLRAVEHCVAAPGDLPPSLDLFGPETATLRELLEVTAARLGRRPRLVPWPGMPEAVFGALLHLLHPNLHPDFLTYLMDMFSAGGFGEDNPAARAAAEGWTPLREVLGEAVELARAPVAPPPQRRQDDETLRSANRVRSIQRLQLPRGKNAAWVAERYFPWLGALMKPFIRTERDADGSWTVRQRLLGSVLLRLEFKPAHSEPGRRLYFITGGLLARSPGGRPARLEFRDLLGGRICMFAIHDFDPALPWRFYRASQAVVHGLVMMGFQGHMEQAAEGEARL